MENTLLEIESSGEIISDKFSYKNWHFWPLIRYEYFLYLQENSHGFKVTKQSFIPKSFWQVLKYIGLSFVKAPFFCFKKYKFVYFGSSGTNVRISNGRYLNRITDYFANINCAETLILEDSASARYFRKRQFPNVQYNDMIRIIARFISQGLIKFTRLTKLRNRVGRFIQFLKENTYQELSDENYVKLYDLLLRRVIEVQFIGSFYKCFFKLINPKLVVVEDGCYGSYYGAILKIANEQDITTGEFQHGTIIKSHLAYNSNLKNAVYETYLPKYLFTYGDYWNANVTQKVSCISIGNPYLSEKLKEIVKIDIRERNSVVFISSSIRPEFEQNFVLELKDKLRFYDVNVFFRIHPLDRNIFKQKYSKIISEGINIDGQDLYSSLGINRFVIAEVSTVLYEALAVPGCIVFGIDSEYAKDIDFEGINKISTVQDFMEIYQNVDESMASNFEYVWKSGWRKNYEEFISTRI